MLLIVLTVPQRAMDCGSGVGRLNQVEGPNRLTPSIRVSVASISQMHK